MKAFYSWLGCDARLPSVHYCEQNDRCEHNRDHEKGPEKAL